MKTKTKTLWTLVLVGSLFAVSAGCQNATTSGDLDNLTEDSNNNGFLDVVPPDGIEFLTLENLNIRLANTINQDDIAGIAQNFGVDPSLLNLATLTAEFTVTLDYGGGITSVINESEPVAPFEKKFEVACPLSANVAVIVKATAPIVGDFTVFEAPFDAQQGVDFECGDTLSYETYVDDAGNPGVR